jgi:hypothetical protein
MRVADVRLRGAIEQLPNSVRTFASEGINCAINLGARRNSRSCRSRPHRATADAQSVSLIPQWLSACASNSHRVTGGIQQHDSRKYRAGRSELSGRSLYCAPLPRRAEQVDSHLPSAIAAAQPVTLLPILCGPWRSQFRGWLRRHPRRFFTISTLIERRSFVLALTMVSARVAVRSECCSPTYARYARRP